MTAVSAELHQKPEEPLQVISTILPLLAPD